MALIWQSSGFWLLLCAVLLFIVGCTMLRNGLPKQQIATPHNIVLMPTLFPTSFSENIIQSPFATTLSTVPSQIFEQSPSQPLDDELYIESPNCYSLSNGQYSCLGKIWNNSENVLGDMSFQISLFDESGSQIGEQIASTEQRITPIGSFAPYRAIISTTNTETGFDEALISMTIMRILPPSPNIQALSIMQAQGHLTDSGRYQLNVTIRNDSGFIAQDIRLFTTLENTEWGVVGYNIYEVGDILQNGQEQLIQLEVIPHALPADIHHSLHVEATINQ